MTVSPWVRRSPFEEGGGYFGDAAVMALSATGEPVGDEEKKGLRDEFHGPSKAAARL